MAKYYYSGVHHLYGVKNELSVEPNGLGAHEIEHNYAFQVEIYIFFVKRNRPIWIWRASHPNKATLETMKMEAVF